MLELKFVPQLSLISHQYPHVQAYLFDMDGTLFNTEKIHIEASWKALNDTIAVKNITKEQFTKQILGMSDDQVIEYYGLDHEYATMELFLKKRKTYWRELLSTGEPIYSPEMEEFLKEIKKTPAKLALVTSSTRKQCSELINSSPFKDFFQLIITRDDVKNPKPHPEPYEMACQKLKVAPSCTVVFEDSQVGFQSAKKAGCQVIKVSWYDQR